MLGFQSVYIHMIRLVLLLLLVVPLNSFAGNSEIFTVQVGTYKHFAEKTKANVSQYGLVHVFTHKNLSRVTVGEFTSRQAAETLKRKLHMAGYKDAFVRCTGIVNLENTSSTIEKFNILISEMDAQAFYLDGHMYLFQGSGYVRIHRSIQ